MLRVDQDRPVHSVVVIIEREPSLSPSFRQLCGHILAELLCCRRPYSAATGLCPLYSSTTYGGAALPESWCYSKVRQVIARYCPSP